ncbi:MAG TPA: hypothetical protein VEA38_05605, partial [Terriglobales bacterium]|nr:hypothetical protein [Terriglobales bacterium]
MDATTLVPPVVPPLTSRAHWLNRAPLYRLAAGAAGAIPRGARLTLAEALGTLAARACRPEAAVVRANLARVTPGLTEAARTRQVATLFRHFAMCVADLVTTNRTPAAAALGADEEGRAHVDAALARGGFVVLTAHVGNWELAGRLLMRRADGRPLHVVMAPEADPAVERLLRADGPVRIVTV